MDGIIVGVMGGLKEEEEEVEATEWLEVEEGVAELGSG